MRPAIRSAMTAYETERLRFWARDRVVVECGALLGYSTVVMAQVARSVVSIDRHTGYDTKPNDTEAIMRNNLERYNVSGKVHVVVDDYSCMAHYSSDLTFIDLDGTLPTTLSAIRRTCAPLIAVHDFHRAYCEGVAGCVDLLAHLKTFRVVDRADTLIVMERKGCISTACA